MAIEVRENKWGKIVLDFWTSPKGNEYLTVRKFDTNKSGQSHPHKTNGCFFTIEDWQEMIPKLREMIYYKTAPPGAPPFESSFSFPPSQGEGEGGGGSESPGDDF